MKVWIDVTSPPHVHFFRALVKRLGGSGHEVLVTSREFGIMNDILERNGIEHVSVGSHGGKDPAGKLVKSSERISELGKLMAREKPDFGLSKHGVECARVCFGLGIPSLSVIDHETAEMQTRLIAPLSDSILAPEATPVDVLRKSGARKVSLFHGVCETAHFHDFRPSGKVLEDLGLSDDDKIVIARSEPLLSSHNDAESGLLPVVQELMSRFSGLRVVFIPRSPEDAARFRKLGVIIPKSSIDTLSLYSFADLMLGAGSCMNREACIGGCPTISMCPDNLPGVDRFLIERGMMSHACGKDDVVELASRILERGRGTVGKAHGTGSGFEDPYKGIMDFLS